MGTGSLRNGWKLRVAEVESMEGGGKHILSMPVWMPAISCCPHVSNQISDDS